MPYKFGNLSSSKFSVPFFFFVDASVIAEVFQGLVKYYEFTRNAENIRNTFIFLTSLYESNRGAHKPNRKILHDCIQTIFLVYLCAELLFLGITIGYIALPALLHLIYGGRHYMYYTFVPGIDETTRNGYIILTTWQLFGPYIAFFGHCAADLTFLVIILHLWPMTKMFAREVADLNDTLRNPDQSLLQLKRMMLRNVLQMHKDLFKYSL